MLPSSRATHYPTLKEWGKSLQGPQQVMQPLSCSGSKCNLQIEACTYHTHSAKRGNNTQSYATQREQHIETANSETLSLGWGDL